MSNVDWGSVANKPAPPTVDPAPKVDWAAASKAPAAAQPHFGDPEKAPNVKPTMNGYVSKYDDHIVAVSKKLGMDPNIIRALHYNEDAADDPNAVSTANAVGFDQMLPDTFKAYADKGASITDVDANITASGRYIQALSKTYKGDMFKVYAAYNAGHYDKEIGADVTAYAKRAQANLQYLESRGETAAAPTSRFTKATHVPGTPTPPPEKHNAAQQAVGTAGDKAGEGVEAGAKFVDDLSAKGAGKAEQLSKYIGSAAWSKLKPEDQNRLKSAFASSASQNALGSVGTVAQAVALVPSLGEAMLRGNEDMGEFGKGFVAAMRDPKEARQIMGALNARYSPLGPMDQAYWVTKPGLFTKAGAQSIDNPLALAAATYATVSQQLYTMPHARDLLAFTIGWLNPANRIPGLVMGAAGKAARLGMDKAVADTGHVGWAAKGVKEKYTEAVRVMPMGDRFYKTAVKAGPQAAYEHESLVTRMSASHGAITDLFTQPNKGGGGIKPGMDDKTLHLYHEKMYNVSNTSHMHAPNAGDTLSIDPHTQALTMRRGAKLDTKSYAEHLEYAHVYSQVKPHQITNYGELFPTGPDGAHFRKFKDKMKQGDVSGALMTHPNANPQEVAKLEAHLAATTASLPPADALRLKATAAKSYLMGMESRRLSKGGTTIPVFVRDPMVKGQAHAGPMEGTVVYGYDQNALARDHSPMGTSQTTVDNRVYNIAMASHQNDQALRAIAPQMGEHLIDGSWSRAGTSMSPGLFEKETPPDIPETLAQQRGGGGGVQARAHRRYDTIDEGIAAGEKMNEQFSPLASLIARASKTDQLIKYVHFMLPHLEDIDYAEAAEGIVGMPEEEEPVSMLGAEGRKNLGKYVKTQAEAKVGAKYGSTWPMIKSSPNGQSEVTNEEARLMKAVEAQYRSANPDRTWNTEDHTGVDDFEGKSLPNHVVEAAQDAHPGFAKNKGRKALLGMETDPENALVQSLDVMSSITRDSFMSVLPYHPARNIASLAFDHGYVNPVEIGQAFVAPDTIDPKLFKAIEDMGLTSQQRGGAGMPMTAFNHRLAAEAKYAGHPNKNQYQNILEIPKRIKAVMDAHKRVAEGRQGLAPPTMWSMMQTAYYHGDKYASDTVFGVHEDALTALTYNKFLKKGYSPERAAHEVRALFGQRANATASERFLSNHLWFYNWFKTQMRLGVKKAFDKRSLALQGGVNAAVASQAGQQENADPSRAVQYGEVQNAPNDDGDQSSVQVSPPMLGYLGASQQGVEGIGSLVQGDPTGLMDFGQYIKNHVEGQLDPRFRPFFDFSAHNSWDLGPNRPQIPKSSSYSVFHDFPLEVAQTAVPSLVPYIAQVSEDPVTFFPELMGFRVSVYSAGKTHVARKQMAQLWTGKGRHGGFESMYYAAGNDPQKQQAVLKQYEQAAAPWIKMLDEAKTQS